MWYVWLVLAFGLIDVDAFLPPEPKSKLNGRPFKLLTLQIEDFGNFYNSFFKVKYLLPFIKQSSYFFRESSYGVYLQVL